MIPRSLAELVHELAPHPLTQWRARHAVTGAEFSRAVGVAQSTLANIEAFRSPASAAMAERVSAAAETLRPGTGKALTLRPTAPETLARIAHGAPFVEAQERLLTYTWQVGDCRLRVFAAGEARTVELVDMRCKRPAMRVHTTRTGAQAAAEILAAAKARGQNHD